MLLKKIGFVFIGFLVASCGSKKIRFSDSKAGEPGVIAIEANWVKDKGNRWDVEFDVMNQHKRGIIILLNEIRCFRGENGGTFKHRNGERTIDFGVNQTKTFRMLCEMGTPAKGEFRIVINRVYDNPSGDGLTTGDVLAKDIDWHSANAK